FAIPAEFQDAGQNRFDLTFRGKAEADEGEGPRAARLYSLAVRRAGMEPGGDITPLIALQPGPALVTGPGRLTFAVTTPGRAVLRFTPRVEGPPAAMRVLVQADGVAEKVAWQSDGKTGSEVSVPIAAEAAAVRIALVLDADAASTSRAVWEKPRLLT